MKDTERFTLDSHGNILDFEDPIARYCTPQKEVVGLLNAFNLEIKQLKQKNRQLNRQIEKLKEAKKHDKISKSNSRN